MSERSRNPLFHARFSTSKAELLGRLYGCEACYIVCQPYMHCPRRPHGDYRRWWHRPRITASYIDATIIPSDSAGKGEDVDRARAWPGWEHVGPVPTHGEDETITPEDVCERGPGPTQ